MNNMPGNESNLAWWHIAIYCLGAFFFAHSLSTLIHECGHAVNGILTGGHVEHIGISAMGWLALAAGAAVLTAALVTWIHLSAPWFNKESVRNHAVTISPLRAMLGLTRGLAVALAIYTLFPE